MQVAPARGKLPPACLGGMHAVVSCVAGPRFRPPKAKPVRKESRAEVGSLVSAPQQGGTGPLSAGPCLLGKNWWGGTPGEAGEEG